MTGKELGQQAAYAMQDMVVEGHVSSGAYGLTKRELFAAMAMQGMAAGQAWRFKPGGNYLSDAATIAVVAADALLNELVKEGVEAVKCRHSFHDLGGGVEQCDNCGKKRDYAPDPDIDRQL